MKNAPVSLFDLPAGGFLVDPKALRPARLKKTIALAACEVERWIAEAGRHNGRSGYRPLFVTLTYAKNTKGSPRDVSRFLNKLQMWMRRQGYPPVFYEWVAELQERGALHYHALLWVPRRVLLPMFDLRGWWPHGATKIERARNPVGYLVKYASKFKGSVQRFRKGTRLYGWGGMPFEVRERVRRVRMARWMRQRVDAKLEAEFMEGIEFEMAEQEAAEQAFQRWVFPDEWPPDPDADPPWLQEQEEREEAEARMVEDGERQSIMERLRRRGWARFSRCVGGFVDKLTGELSATPWAAEFRNGVLWVWPKEAV